MHIHTPPPWEISANRATPEAVWRGRRRFLRALGYGAAGLALTATRGLSATAGFPSERNPDFLNPTDRDLTDYDLITSYNNFYEFGTGKDDPKKYANRGWQTEPWTLEVGGHVRKPLKIDVNDLIRRVGGIEQRVYRFRCVEAWSMIIPWDGFVLRKLLDLVEPTSKAKYVRFTSFFDPEEAPGQRRPILPWPYVEGLRMDEARHPLTFLATGIYGKPIPNQNGAPTRLVVPWKYGFKGIKSIVRIDLVDKQPVNTWNEAAPREYGFYANVNPQVDHPRWSQATERVIGEGSFLFAKRIPTLMFNGYGEEVASLYAGMDLTEKF